MQDFVLDEISKQRGMPRGALEEARLNAVWLARAASADECAGVICFLLSDDAGYMTGQAINLSGGLVTW
jgi:NAD(P)-dependent dehydrogenase (short-subunit alcohol dehydrogenase family)